MWLSAVKIYLASGSITTQAIPSWARPGVTIHVLQPKHLQTLFYIQVPLEVTKQWKKASDGSKRSSGTWDFYLSWLWDVAHRTHPGTIEWTHGCMNLCVDGLKVFEIIGGSKALSQSCFHSEHMLLDHSEFLSVLRIHLILTFSWNKPNYRIHTPQTPREQFVQGKEYKH